MRYELHYPASSPQIEVDCSGDIPISKNTVNEMATQLRGLATEAMQMLDAGVVLAVGNNGERLTVSVRTCASFMIMSSFSSLHDDSV